jgi:hypothetical protein
MGVGAGFAPWIWRASIALQLTAPGLAEFVKFLPEIRTGQIKIERLYFLLPLFVTMLAAPMLVENKRLAWPGWLRWGLRIGVIPLALASLSPVWTPAILRAPEFRLQTVLAATAISLTFAAHFFKKLPLKPLVVGLAIGGAIALILPGRQFSLIHTSLVETYHEPVSLGWGWWLTVAGVVLSIGGGLWLAFQPVRRQIDERPADNP